MRSRDARQHARRHDPRDPRAPCRLADTRAGADLSLAGVRAVARAPGSHHDLSASEAADLRVAPLGGHGVHLRPARRPHLGPWRAPDHGPVARRAAVPREPYLRGADCGFGRRLRVLPADLLFQLALHHGAERVLVRHAGRPVACRLRGAGGAVGRRSWRSPAAPSTIILTRALRLQFDNLDLATDCAPQKELAERSQCGEVALPGLRQPRPAPAGACARHVRRARCAAATLDAGARRLVDQIDASVAALDDLFTSLLDISRLDAGVVAAAGPQSFALQPLLRAHLPRRTRPKPSARASTLHACAASLAVRERPGAAGADPAQPGLQRGALHRAAAAWWSAAAAARACSIEVWDTGRGIAPTSRSRSSRNSTRSAIRTATAARGSAWAWHRAAPDAICSTTPLYASLAGPARARCSACRVARARPQAGRGADRGRGAGSRGAAALIAGASTTRSRSRTRCRRCSPLGPFGDRRPARPTSCSRASPSSARPDLIICDYRLRGGENGIDGDRAAARRASTPRSRRC